MLGMDQVKRWPCGHMYVPDGTGKQQASMVSMWKSSNVGNHEFELQMAHHHWCTLCALCTLQVLWMSCPISSFIRSSTVAFRWFLHHVPMWTKLLSQAICFPQGFSQKASDSTMSDFAECSHGMEAKRGGQSWVHPTAAQCETSKQTLEQKQGQKHQQTTGQDLVVDFAGHAQVEIFRTTSLCVQPFSVMLLRRHGDSWCWLMSVPVPSVLLISDVK